MPKDIIIFLSGMAAGAFSTMVLIGIVAYLLLGA